MADGLGLCPMRCSVLTGHSRGVAACQEVVEGLDWLGLGGWVGYRPRRVQAEGLEGFQGKEVKTERARQGGPLSQD